MEHHACANLEHLFPYSRHFSANAQGAPGNNFRLLEKHGRELVWTLIGIVQIVGSGNGTPSGMGHLWEWVLLPYFNTNSKSC